METPGEGVGRSFCPLHPVLAVRGTVVTLRTPDPTRPGARGQCTRPGQSSEWCDKPCVNEPVAESTSFHHRQPPPTRLRSACLPERGCDGWHR